MKTITYAINGTGLVVSRVGSEIAWPILEYDKMLPENSWEMDYHLEKMAVFSVAGYVWDALKWTKKIPKKLKNIHREFWGFSKLK